VLRLSAAWWNLIVLEKERAVGKLGCGDLTRSSQCWISSRDRDRIDMIFSRSRIELEEIRRE
jgi:hypothetical protein